MKIDLELGGHSEAFVRDQLNSGRYADAGDLVRDALRLMEARDQARDDLRQKIEAGWQSIQAGRVSDGEAFMAALMNDLDSEPSNGSA